MKQYLEMAVYYFVVKSNMAACMLWHHPFAVSVHNHNSLATDYRTVGSYIINYVLCDKLTKNSGKTSYIYYWKQPKNTWGNAICMGPIITAQWMSWWISIHLLCINDSIRVLTRKMLFWLALTECITG